MVKPRICGHTGIGYSIIHAPMNLKLLFLLLLVIVPTVTQATDEEMIADLHEQVVQVPVQVKGLFGSQEVQLTATVYRPDGNGPFPLVVLNHGSRTDAIERVKIGRFRRIPQIREFIKRGFAVIVPIRRGHGVTGGDYVEDFGKCSAPDYYQPACESARDVLAARDFGSKMPFVNPECILLVGQSAGGLACLAAASFNPPGVIGVVNFSGGSGGNPVTHPGEPCSPQSMVIVISKFAESIKVPVLWHYAENDKFFSPKYVREWFSAFEECGGKGRFVMQPPFGDDGHTLFLSRKGIPIWTRALDSFLKDFDIGGEKCRIAIKRAF